MLHIETNEATGGCVAKSEALFMTDVELMVLRRFLKNTNLFYKDVES